MTETPIRPLIIRLAVPTVISNLISTIYNAADTFFIGLISTSASAAVGAAIGTFVPIPVISTGVGAIIGGAIGLGQAVLKDILNF